MTRRKRAASTSITRNNNDEDDEPTQLQFAFIPCKIQQLSPNIVIDILSRLPIKSILDCRCVCKTWLHLISHRRFAELHLSRSSVGILIKTIPSVNDSRKISLTLVEENGRTPFQLERLTFSPKINLPSSKFGLVNSCNGLLCLSGGEREDPIWVCNPILGEFVAIPSISKGRNWGSFVGLGCCSQSHRYKVVQTFHPKVKLSGNDYLEAEIYYMDTGTWRSIGYAPCALVVSSFNSFTHSSLHWVPTTGNNAECIYSFNFKTEEFGSVPPPPCLCLERTKRGFSNSLKVGVVEDCLFLCVFGDDYRKFDIWVMKDYGVKESWTKQFAIEILYPRQRSCDVYQPVKFLNNGEILMLYNDLEVVCYNPKSKRLRGTRVTRTRFEFNSIGHTPSFVSLYHVAKRELVQRIQGSKESSAEGSIDRVDTGHLEMPPDEPARMSSNLYQGQPTAMIHFAPDQRTTYTRATGAEYFGNVAAAQGFSAPFTNGVSNSLAPQRPYPFF